MFDFFVKILASGIAGIIFFSPLNLELKDTNLYIRTTLENPITEDIVDLINQGYEFKVDYYCSAIINDRKVHKTSIVKSINSTDYNKSDFSNIEIVLKNVIINDGDEVLIFIKAKIMDDPIFKESTGLDTKILWQNHVPREKKVFVYSGNKFIE